MAFSIRAPFAGFSSALTEIPDEVFARAMLGEGAALDPTDSSCASCDGEAISVAAARTPWHCCSRREVPYVGIDTVTLGGEGFTVLVGKGDRVHVGDLLLRFDLDQLAHRARSLLTPVIVTNGERFRVVRARLDQRVASGEVLFELEEISAAATVQREAARTPVVGLFPRHGHGPSGDGRETLPSISRCRRSQRQSKGAVPYGAWSARWG